MRAFSRLSVIAVAVAIGVAGCARNPSRSVYSYEDVGRSTAVSFGTVLSSRTVDIVGKTTGTGALIGAAAGAGGGSYVGSGSGTAWAVGAGAIGGAIAGAAAEQAMVDRQGIEYVVVLESGTTVTILQEKVEGDVIIPNGGRVMVQSADGYQRVLPAEHLPTRVNRPQGITVVDPARPATQ